MGYAQAAKIINAPVEDVWFALNDVKNTPKWVVGLENAEVITTGAYGLGTIYNDYNRLGTMHQITAWHITEFEPMSHQVHISESASLPLKMTLNLSPTSQGTFLEMSVEFQFMPRWGVLGQFLETLLMKHLLRSVLTQNIDRLNKYLQHKSGDLRTVTSQSL